MLKILHKSSDPCFMCKSRDKVALVKGSSLGSSFTLSLCMTHAWELVPETDKSLTKDTGTDKKPGPLEVTVTGR